MSQERNNLKAKVFISCGQNKNTDEVNIAQSIAEKLTEKGFDYYIAVQEQSLKGVTENIFKQLETSEYFLFIDFKRENILPNNNEIICRGSLFSHQELAVASYLGIKTIAFQEKGVKPDDGIMRFIQANCIYFDDRQKLSSLVIDKILKEQWNSQWKNQLKLEYQDYSTGRLPLDISENTSDVSSLSIPTSMSHKKQSSGAPARFYHIVVKNLHKNKMAINCIAYLKSVQRIPGNVTNPKTVEFKWAGYILPNAMIPPNSERSFDAFYASESDPFRLLFNEFTDFYEYDYCIRGPGDFELTYVVVSENFPPAERIFKVHIGNFIDDIKVTKL